MTPKPLEPELDRFLRERLQMIRQIYSPQELILFGSRAEGKGHAYSDIDLIIVSDRFRGQRSLDRAAEFVRQIAWDRHIDALCYTPEEFERKRRELGLVARAAREGIRVLPRG